MAQEIERNTVRLEMERDLLYISGKGFHFNFSKEQVDILDIIERMKLRYISDVPHLLAEYSDKNPWPPEGITIGSDKKVLWICSICRHEWSAPAYSRKNGHGCPGCSGLVVTAKNSLAVLRPDLIEEYSEKNTQLPDQVSIGNDKNVWWKCSKCFHEWQTAPYNRSKLGSGCPACANRTVTVNNNLLATHPEIVKDYSDKNELPPDKIVAGTTRELLWKCYKCGYEWKENGDRRIRGLGCRACRGLIAISSNNLAFTHPHLIAEYSTKNKFPIEQFTSKSRERLWWICSKCQREWQSSAYYRSMGYACRSCSGRERWRKVREANAAH